MIQRASRWTAAEIRAATSGEHFGPPAQVAGVSTDTRDALENQLFVALRGERFDAHDFLDKAVEAGAAALLLDRKANLNAPRIEALAEKVAVILCDDTTVGLGDLANAHRRRQPAKVIGLTGSNGKTTTKEMLAAILEVRARVLKTHGNLNNLIGLPMTLLGLDSEDVCVAEMGMNAPGEIARLTEIAEPDVGLITNVGPAHIGELGSLDAIADAKTELFDGLPKNARAVVNAADPMIMSRRPTGHVRTFGTPDADVFVSEVQDEGDGQRLELIVDGAKVSLLLPIIGRHNADNAAGAVAVATAPELGDLRADADAIIAGLERVQTLKGRLEPKNIGAFRVIDDSYNANAASMIAAIRTIGARAHETGARFVALLGEMRELGTFSDREHARVGDVLAEVKADVVASFGPLAAPIADRTKKLGLISRHESDDVDTLFTWLMEHVEAGDFILVKGSRGIRMERFISRIQDLAEGRD